MSSDDPPDGTDQVIEPAGIESTAQIFPPRVANVSAAGTVTSSGTVEARVISARERELERLLAQPAYVVHVLAPEHVMKLEALLGRMTQAYETGQLNFRSRDLELDFVAMRDTLIWSTRSSNAAGGIAQQAVTWFYRNVLRDLPANATKMALIQLALEALKFSAT